MTAQQLLSKARPSYLIATILLLLLLAGCIAYILLPYDTLKNWYLGLGDCFYRSDTWSTAFFTPLVKQKAMAYCLLAIGLCGTGILLCLRALRSKDIATVRIVMTVCREDRLYLLLVLLCATALWCWGLYLVKPGFDEVFSAVNCAQLHPFQTWSYYMLPNNHVLFNLLNNILFFFTDNKLLGARLISLGCYLLLAAVLYHWLRHRVAHRILAVGITLVLCQQFPVWAFGFQGRGYELYLLCQWVALLAALAWFRSGARSWLLLLSCCIVAGYGSVLTFLYFHAALLLLAVLLDIRQRKVSMLFWKYQAIAMGCVYLFYLPLLCFSGADALLENRYVAAGNDSLPDFLLKTAGYLPQAIQYCFAGFVDDRNPVYFIAFAMPLLLLLRWGNPVKRYGLFFILFWLVSVALIICMKRLPFMRNLIGQYSMTLAFSLLAYDAVCRLLSRKIKVPVAGPVLTFAGLLLVSWHFIRFNADHVNDTIYSYDAKARYEAINAGAERLPGDAVVGLSQEGFFWEYLCRKRSVHVARCPDGTEQFYIRQDSEPAPAFLPAYTLKFKVQEYEVYERTAKR